MNRRNLLRMLAGAAIAPGGLIVPERKFFLPPAGGWPTNVLDTLTLKDIERCIAILDEAAIPPNADGYFIFHYGYNHGTGEVAVKQIDSRRFFRKS